LAEATLAAVGSEGALSLSDLVAIGVRNLVVVKDVTAIML
jgi:hypothetical protein